MDRNIQISVENRVARVIGKPKIICGNCDYNITFTFDDEWENIEVKTLRVSYNGTYSDHVFTGNVVELPPIVKAYEVYIGVFAGEITSTKVIISAEPSILCAGGSVADPEPDVYRQIVGMIEDGMLKGDPGEPGPAGPTGPQGMPGKDGEPYTLPTASADVKGGVMVGEGLKMDGDVLGVKPEPGYELIKAITLDEEVKSIVCGGYYEKALGLKDVYISIETPDAAANGYVNVYAYGITGFRITAVTITDIITKAQKHSSIEMLKKEYGYRCSYKSKTIGSVTEWHDMHSESNGVIGKIQIDATTSGVLFPADTKIEIWGVRA